MVNLYGVKRPSVRVYIHVGKLRHRDNLSLVERASRSCFSRVSPLFMGPSTFATDNLQLLIRWIVRELIL